MIGNSASSFASWASSLLNIYHRRGAAGLFEWHTEPPILLPAQRAQHKACSGTGPPIWAGHRQRGSSLWIYPVAGMPRWADWLRYRLLLGEPPGTPTATQHWLARGLLLGTMALAAIGAYGWPF
jgi:hypothetical protein